MTDMTERGEGFSSEYTVCKVWGRMLIFRPSGIEAGTAGCPNTSDDLPCGLFRRDLNGAWSFEALSCVVVPSIGRGRSDEDF